jgi:hypothetical protein
VLVIPDNNIVQDINPDDLSGFHQPFRQADILLGFISLYNPGYIKTRNFIRMIM